MKKTSKVTSLETPIILGRRERSIKKLRAQVRETQAEVVTLAGKLDQALALYDTAREIIRKHQDADAQALQRYELDAMDRAERRDAALAEALKNEIEVRVASLEAGMDHKHLRREADMIAELLLFWPCSPTVTGIVAAATNRDGEPQAKASEDGDAL